jgi:hypothetical protein
MNLWLNAIQKKTSTQDHGVEVCKALLFMDDCSAHDNDGSVAAMAEGEVNVSFFTQLYSYPVNKKLKEVCRLLCEVWYREKGCKSFTPAGNLRRATDDEVNEWIVKALSTITASVVRECWKRTTDVINL